MTRKTWFSWVAAGMLGLAAGVSGAAPSVTVASSAPVADTVQGKVTGITRTLPGTDLAADAFLGIPYAEPPVGDLRWKPAAPAKTGLVSGTPSGTRRRACSQKGDRKTASTPISTARPARSRTRSFRLPCISMAARISREALQRRIRRGSRRNPV